MKRLIPSIILAAFALLPAGAAQAGVAEGERAFLAADYGTALTEIGPAARAGDADAQYLLGVMYSQGKGVKRHYLEAASWYRLAAAQDHALAAFNLGFMYAQGAGEGAGAIAAQPERAVPWLRQSALADYPMAQTLLGAMYYRGEGVERNLIAAATLTLRAAEQGNPLARYNAGLMLGNGEGVSPNATEAYALFAVLADQGYPGAARNRDIIADRLGAESLAEAEARARELAAGG